jgi:hypothetical protein
VAAVVLTFASDRRLAEIAQRLRRRFRRSKIKLRSLLSLERRHDSVVVAGERCTERDA